MDLDDKRPEDARETMREAHDKHRPKLWNSMTKKAIPTSQKKRGPRQRQTGRKAVRRRASVSKGILRAL